jgi:hypothetical protein
MGGLGRRGLPIVASAAMDTKAFLNHGFAAGNPFTPIVRYSFFSSSATAGQWSTATSFL